MTEFPQREELHAFTDGAALIGVAICAVIGFAWAVAGKDTAMVLAGTVLMVASAMAAVYLLDRLRGKAPPVEETGYADGVIRAGVIATVFWGLAGFLVGDVIAWQLAFPALNLDLEWTSFGRLRPIHTSAVIFAFGGNSPLAVCRRSAPEADVGEAGAARYRPSSGILSRLATGFAMNCVRSWRSSAQAGQRNLTF
jgi:cytochrome c oxidase cbb3-type subunit 1